MEDLSNSGNSLITPVGTIVFTIFLISIASLVKLPNTVPGCGRALLAPS